MGKVYKLCDCGFMNIFEEGDIAPRRCEECGRNILQKDTFSLEEYEKKKAENEEPEEEDTSKEKTECQVGLFKLVNEEKNIEIVLPEHDDFVIGREGIGREYFGTTVSRNHLYVSPRGSMGFSVVDKESLNGTKINGEVIAKGATKIVIPGNTITLDINESGITFTLLKIE